jgi:TRAP-type C4-dicarboxylate transport system substrate-binding protein
MLTNHAREVTFTLVSQSCLDKLTKDNQQILLEAIDNAASWANEQTNKEEEGFMKRYQEENGIELVEVDDAAFREALAPVAEKLSADDPELYAEIQKLEQ